MDAYEQAWHGVARSRSWTEVLHGIETSRRYEAYGYDQDYLVRRAERNAQYQAMERYTHELEPVAGWVGACWLRPDGKAYPVRFCNHTERAGDIARHLGYKLSPVISAETILCRRGWLRISADGKVTDAQWNREDDWTDEQEATIREMEMKARNGQHFNAWMDSDFANGLKRSIEYAYGVLEQELEEAYV